MKKIEKLRKLLHHWMEHNTEQAETYRGWSAYGPAGERPGLKAIRIVSGS